MSEPRIILIFHQLDRGYLKSFVDLILFSEWGEVTVKGFKLFQKPGSHPWVVLPSTSYMKNGELHYKPMLELSPSLSRRIKEEILSQFSKISEAKQT